MARSNGSSAKKSDDGIGMMGLFDAEPNATDKKGKDKTADKNNDTTEWTKEQDDELMRRKSEGETWAEIVTAMNKEKSELAKRFGQIKPSDWRPNQQPGKNKKGGKQDQNANTKKGGGGGTKGETSKAENNDNAGGIDNNNNNNNNGYSTWNSPPENTDLNAGVADWPAPATGGDPLPTNTNGDDKNRDESRRERHKKSHESRRDRHGSRHTPSGTGRSSENGSSTLATNYENLFPDGEFSLEELTLLSSILKEDTSEMWLRVASRFRDKTGRVVHPRVFEEKIRGKRTKKVDVKDV